MWRPRFSGGESDFYDESGDSLERDDDDGYLGKDTCAVETSDPGLCEDGEIVFGRGVGGLGSRAEGLELLMTIRVADDLGNQPWELSNGHVSGETAEVDPVGTISGKIDDGGICLINFNKKGDICHAYRG